jgi:hypothetical protein
MGRAAACSRTLEKGLCVSGLLKGCSVENGAGLKELGLSEFAVPFILFRKWGKLSCFCLFVFFPMSDKS